MDRLLGTSNFDWCIRTIYSTKWKIVPMHFCSAAILTTLLKVMSLLEEDIRGDSIENGWGNLRYVSCCNACPITLKPYTQASMLVATPAAKLRLIESCRLVVEKHQSIIDRGTMDIFSGRPIQVYVASLSAKPILFTKDMVVKYASIALDYIVPPRAEKSNLKRKKKVF